MATISNLTFSLYPKDQMRNIVYTSLDHGNDCWQALLYETYFPKLPYLRGVPILFRTGIEECRSYSLE